MPAVLQAARGPAWPLLRARAAGRRAGADHLRALIRLLHRPDREEAAESFLAWNAGVFIRHRRLQSDVQVLPELRHQQSQGNRSAEPGRNSHDDRGCGAPARVQVGGVHLQRPGDLPGIRGRYRARLPRGRTEDGRGDRRLHHAGGARRVLCRHRRGECGPEGVHRAVLSQPVRWAARRRARYAGVDQAPHRCLAGGHHAADPGRERFRCRDRRARRLVCRRAWPRCAAAFLGVPSRLAHARSSADPAGHADPRTGDRDEPRSALRLYRQRA